MAIYCTHGDVSAFLQVDGFTDSPATTPTQAQVETFIEMAEERIDKLTDHAWHANRYKTATDERARIQCVNANTLSYRGRIQLRHYPIVTLASGSGDTLNIWSGGSYTEYLANKTAGTLTDPLSGDFWADTERGLVYLKSWPTLFVSTAPSAIDAYVKYRYGTATTPDDIKLAAIYLTSSIIASNDDLNLMPAVDDSMDNRTKSEAWEALGLKMLEPHIGRNMPLARTVAGFGTVR